MKNIYIAIVVIVVLALLVFVYFKYISKSYKTTTPTQTQTQSVGQNTVTIKNLSFNPTNIEITKGTKVTWTNEDSLNHTVTSNDNKFGSGQLANGAKFEFTFNDAGTFAYHCSNHPSMTGQVVVK